MIPRKPLIGALDASRRQHRCARRSQGKLIRYEEQKGHPRKEDPLEKSTRNHGPELFAEYTSLVRICAIVKIAGYNLRRIGDSEKLYATIALTGNTVHEDYDSVGGDSFGQAKHRPRATAYRRPPETTGRRDEKRREKRDLLS